jgi:hypothetical protein
MELEAVGRRDSSASAGAPLRQPEPYLVSVLVSVVVVVTGAGTVVCCDVVVVLCSALSDSQPVSERTVTAIMQGMMSFFIGIIMVARIVTFPRLITLSADQMPWGETLPCARRRNEWVAGRATYPDGHQVESGTIIAGILQLGGQILLKK